MFTHCGQVDAGLTLGQDRNNRVLRVTSDDRHVDGFRRGLGNIGDEGGGPHDVDGGEAEDPARVHAPVDLLVYFAGHRYHAVDGVGHHQVESL